MLIPSSGCIDIYSTKDLITSPPAVETRYTNQMVFSLSKDFTFQDTSETYHTFQYFDIKPMAENLNIYVTVKYSPQIMLFINTFLENSSELKDAISSNLYNVMYSDLNDSLKPTIDSIYYNIMQLAGTFNSTLRYVNIKIFMPNGNLWQEKIYNSTIIGDVISIKGPMEGAWSISVDAKGTGINDKYHDSFSIKAYAYQPEKESL